MLAVVFLLELAAVAAAAVWGQWYAGPWLALVAAVAVLVAWWLFASPRAPLAGPVVRPVTKVLVFGLASAGLWASGHRTAAAVLVMVAVAAHALAALPSVRALTEESPGG